MGLEDKNAQHYGEVVDKFTDPHAHYHMTTRDYVMRPRADAGSGAYTIVLPRVAEAKGRFYSFISLLADAVNTITITHADDSECWWADIVLVANCERLLLYSDGRAWHPLIRPGEWPGASTKAPGTSSVTLAPTTEYIIP